MSKTNPLTYVTEQSKEFVRYQAPMHMYDGVRGGKILPINKNGSTGIEMVFSRRQNEYSSYSHIRPGTTLGKYTSCKRRVYDAKPRYYRLEITRDRNIISDSAWEDEYQGFFWHRCYWRYNKAHHRHVYDVHRSYVLSNELELPHENVNNRFLWAGTTFRSYHVHKVNMTDLLSPGAQYWGRDDDESVLAGWRLITEPRYVRTYRNLTQLRREVDYLANDALMLNGIKCCYANNMLDAKQGVKQLEFFPEGVGDHSAAEHLKSRRLQPGSSTDLFFANLTTPTLQDTLHTLVGYKKQTPGFKKFVGRQFNMMDNGEIESSDGVNLIQIAAELVRLYKDNSILAHIKKQQETRSNYFAQNYKRDAVLKLAKHPAIRALELSKQYSLVSEAATGHSYLADTMHQFEYLDERNVNLWDEIEKRQVRDIKSLHDQLIPVVNKVRHQPAIIPPEPYKYLREAETWLAEELDENQFSLVYPNNTLDIVNWGTEQSHCLGSYTHQAKSSTYLIFGVMDNESKTWAGHANVHPGAYTAGQFLAARNTQPTQPAKVYLDRLLRRAKHLHQEATTKQYNDTRKANRKVTN